MKKIKIYVSLCWLFFCGWSLGADCQGTVPQPPIVTLTSTTIQIKYPIILGNNSFRTGDRCLITHLNNNLFFTKKGAPSSTISTIKLSKIFFERIPSNDAACAGNNWPNSTTCPAAVQAFSTSVAAGSFSYLIPSNTVGILYDVIYEFSGTVKEEWQFCPLFSTTTRTATVSNISTACARGTPNVPTCSLTVPSTVTVPTATLNDFVLTGKRGTNTEAKGTSFNIRINCAPPSTSFTPTVTFSYGEGVTCMPGNGATSATAAKNIGFAIKTSVTSANSSDYICGVGGGNVVSFPATTANAIYDQSKTFFVNYAIQALPRSSGFVQANVTLTADFP